MHDMNVLSDDSEKLMANSTIANLQQQTTNVKHLALLALFVSIEFLLFLTPLGFVPIGPIHATTLHIPVIIAAILLGPRAGLSIGFCFAILSLIKNTFSPTLTSFVFSPFYSFGQVHGSLASLWIAVGPRLILGFGTAICFAWLFKILKNRILAAALSASIMTFTHTILVVTSIYCFFAEPYAAVRKTTTTTLFAVISTIVTLNGIMEVLLATFIAVGFVRVVQPTWLK